MTRDKLRWGILSAADIARKNWRAIRLSGNGLVTAVASRDLEKGRRFISECQADEPFDPAPRAFGRYEDLLASDEVDAVYIPLPTGIRKEWVLRAAEAGKHVVCEKPCALHTEDLRDMIEACRRRNLQFMDGVMFMHSRRLDQLRAVLDDGATVGQVKRIESAFSFCGPEEFRRGNIRVHSGLEPYGCLGDLGWYCIRFALWVAGCRMPRHAAGRILMELGRPDSPAPVPVEFSGELLFEGGVSSGFYCSFVTGNQQWASISGTAGYARLADFVTAFRGDEVSFETQNSVFNKKGCDFSHEPHLRRFTVAEHSHGHASSQEANLFRNFAAGVLAGRIDEHWPEIALKTQIVMEACLRSARAGGAAVELS